MYVSSSASACWWVCMCMCLVEWKSAGHPCKHRRFPFTGRKVYGAPLREHEKCLLKCLPWPILWSPVTNPTSSSHILQGQIPLWALHLPEQTKFRTEDSQIAVVWSRVDVLSLGQSGESSLGHRKSPALYGYWEVWEVKISHLLFLGNPRQPPPELRSRKVMTLGRSSLLCP